MKLLSLLLLLRTASCALQISSLWLVDTSVEGMQGGQDIMAIEDNTVIDTSVVGKYLSVRADVSGNADCLEFEVDDGKVQRTERAAPFFLAGNNGNQVHASVHLTKIGFHTISVRKCEAGKTTRKRAAGSATRPDSRPGKRNAGLRLAEVDPPLHDEDRNLVSLEELTVTFEVRDGANHASVKLPTTDVTPYVSDVYGALNGELKKWHKITLGFSGPIAGELGMTRPGTYRKPSVAADYRVDVMFTHSKTKKQYKVPGYYAGNGDAANGGTNGNVWLVHFTPDETGVWNWQAEFMQGTNIAQNGGGDPAGFFNEVYGSFDVEETDKQGADLRSKGRLEYVGEHYLKFAETDEYFIKVGPDSPSNLLAYSEFDDTPNNGRYRKNYRNHQNDYVVGQPTWSKGRGRGLIGAINYLASKGMNVMTVTLISDDKNVFPFASERKLDYDVSKLAQWEVVFEYAEQKGIALHIKLMETDDDEIFGDNKLSEARKLFYHEMVARFSHHLAVTWDLGKEASRVEYVKDRSAFLRSMDPYKHPIVVQADSSLLGVDSIDGTSLQSDSPHADTIEWLSQSAAIGKKWIVSVDQTADTLKGVLPDGDDSNLDEIRKNLLWGNLMAGGWGVQYLFGTSFSESDLTLQDFRSRNKLFEQSRYALDFFGKIPFWEMETKNEWAGVGTANSVLATSDNSIIVFYKGEPGNQPTINLPGTDDMYSVWWFDPRKGGQMKRGRLLMVKSGSNVSLGEVPYSPDDDWVALLRCFTCADN